jgi:hypothetical protein
VLLARHLDNDFVHHLRHGFEFELGLSWLPGIGLKVTRSPPSSPITLPPLSTFHSPSHGNSERDCYGGLAFPEPQT